MKIEEQKPVSLMIVVTCRQLHLHPSLIYCDS